VTTTERNIHLGLLGASLAVAAWIFGAEWRTVEPATHSRGLSPIAAERSPLSLIPAGSAFLLSADLRALAREPLGVFIAQRLGRNSGASKLAESCGEGLLSRLDRVALGVPNANLTAQDQPEDFGIVASGRFGADEIMRCATTAISARSGEAIRTKLGSFESVRDRKASSGEVAARDGLVVVSGGRYFRELLDAAESAHRRGAQQDAQDPRHAALRRELGPGPLLATWLLGDDWFERVAGGETNARLSPLSTLKAVSARLNVAQRAELLVLLDCTDSEGATRLAALLGELRSSLGALPLDPALTGVATRITVNQSGARLKLQVQLSQAELSPVLDTLLSR
jgi:hypothetical protein